MLPAEARGQRSWPGLRQPVEQLQRQPCEPGPGRHREEGGGAGAQHGGNPPAGLPEQPFQDGVEGWLHVAGRAGTGRREHRCVVVDPRVAGEIAESGPACQQRMAVAGHDAGGELDETLAAQERRKRPAGVGAVFVTSVTLPIVKRGGSRELTVKVTSSNSSGLPFRTVLAFTSPSSIRDGWNTFTVASGEDPVLDTNTDYFIVVAQSGGSGNVLGWLHTTSDSQSP